MTAVLAAAQPRRARPWWLRVLIALALLAATGYGAALAFIYLKQESLLFRPDRLAEAHRFNLADVTEVAIPVDGAVLSALHFRQPNPRGVVFFLHGNSGSLANWLTSTEFYRRTGYDLFMIDYRGFGKSTGQIDGEAQMHADVRRAWDTIAPQYAGKQRVIYGRSLGTGLAARLARDVPADLLVLVSPYFSMQAMADEYYPWVPGFLIRYPLRTDQWLRDVKAPILTLHGSDDRLIRFSHAERLQALVPAMRLVRVEGARHSDIQRFPAYLDALAERLTALSR